MTEFDVSRFLAADAMGGRNLGQRIVAMMLTWGGLIGRWKIERSRLGDYVEINSGPTCPHCGEPLDW